MSFTVKEALQALNSVLPASHQEVPNNFVYNYQSLIGAGLSVAAAAVGIFYLYRQINQTEALATRERLAKRTAARAVLVLTLSLINRYATQSVSIYLLLLDKLVDNTLPRSIPFPAFPELPAGVIADLKEAITYGDDIEKEAYAEIIRALQVFIARQLGNSDANREHHIIARENIEEEIIDGAEIYARGSSLFDFARGNDTAQIEIAVSPAGISNALAIMGILPGAHYRIWSTVRRRYKIKAEKD
ncbi:hypothetical protein NLY43_04290 [Mesorhizobium sp. C416B]|uniref:hypothetical protein n=1 Tax=unclassified Mesorhizobium TaxID=325217 RepID=UPI0003CF1F37|nr:MULTISPECIES: hypothetical protein [unclassified Mesorhizobium]ESX47734.1 hypothetical protein X762_17920 [Mesorhizobium sp. LSHC426A00]ESX51757.1 hypothetical protein X761_24375 [Mesorhizobium sp. LSHC424B00]ESX69927.1 hypothetical protein X758_19040 [Mesorhizobium sp. LSHC416B00]ESX71844.1 hypothetical protein X757_22340 [Mesorhizobium sp. LSHC414A00]WJI63995.1 hypothetical protein NLY43_04290 [Mesorhizobium sp. C416B]